MRRVLLAVLGIVLVLGMITLPPAPIAEAGGNGQQLHFFTQAGRSKISWIQVKGTYYTNRVETWSKTLNPPLSSYSLTNYWWKSWDGRNVEVSWRLANGVTGYCTIRVPVSMQGDWISVDLSYNGGRTCYPS